MTAQLDALKDLFIKVNALRVASAEPSEGLFLDARKLTNCTFTSVEEARLSVLASNPGWNPHQVSFQLTMKPANISVTSGGEIEEVPGCVFAATNVPDVIRSRYGTGLSRVYIRRSYVEIADLELDNMSIDNIDDNHATLFTGVPGIGKSLFMVYFLARFLSDTRFADKTFALELEHGMYHYFQHLPEDVFGPHQYLCTTLPATMFTERTFLLLVDLKETAEPRSRAKWTCIFSSPNAARYKDTMKDEPSRQYIMPTWSQEELQFVNNDVHLWYEAFTWCGGVPRLVFSPQYFELIQEALVEKGGRMSNQFFEYGFGGIDAESSYIVMHINPPRTVDGVHTTHPEHQHQYQSVMKVRTFASDKVFSKLVQLRTTSITSQALDVFNTGVASSMYGAVSAGKLFEKIVLYLKRLEDLQQPVCANVLSSTTNETLYLHLPRETQWLPYDWKTRTDLLLNITYNPQISNLTSGDSFCAVSDKPGEMSILVKQVTVGETHKIKANGLVDIVMAYRRSHPMLKIAHKLFLFVLPSNGSLNTIQTLTTLQDTDMIRTRQDANGFVQCVYRHYV